MASRLPVSEQLPDSVRGAHFVSAVAWTSGAKWIAQLVSWPVTILVARLLAPSDYGLVGMATLVIGMIALAAGLGIGTIVVTQRIEAPNVLRQLNCLTVLVGVAAFVAVGASAGVVARLLHADPLVPVLTALGTTFVLDSIRMVPEALLIQQRRFRSLAGLEVGRALLASVVTLVTALLGWGYWSLVAGHLSSSLFGAISTLSLCPVGFGRPTWRVIGPFMRVGLDIVGFHLGWYAYTYSDSLVTGSILGPTALGTYVMAGNLSNAPVDKLGATVHRVSPSFFAAKRDDRAALRDQFLRVTEGIALITMPACVGLALVADDLVLAVLGPNWHGTVVPLRILCIYNLLRCVSVALTPLLLVLGESRHVLVTTLVAATVLPLSFIAGTAGGVGGVAAVWLVAYPLITLSLCVRLFPKIQVTTMDYLRALSVPSGPTLVMASALLALRYFLPPEWSPALRASLQVGLGLVTWTSALLLLSVETARWALLTANHLFKGQIAPGRQPHSSIP